MSDIKSWSPLASGNDAAAPDGFPEGMAPGDVNNAAREVMAAIRRQHEQAEWIDLGHAPAFASASSFTVAGDVASVYHAGRRVRLTDAGTLHGRITASSYSAPNTTVELALDGGSLSASLSAVAVAAISGTGGNRSVTPESIGAAAKGVIADADGDTKVEVEAAADEDVIRFDAGGAEVMRLTPTGMKLPSANIFTGSVYNLFTSSGALDLTAGQFHEAVFDIGPNGGYFHITIDGQHWRTGSLTSSALGVAFYAGSTTAAPGKYLSQLALQPGTTTYTVAARSWATINHWGMPNYGNGGGFGHLSSAGPFSLSAAIGAGDRLSVAMSAKYSSGQVLLDESLTMRAQIVRVTNT